MKKYSRVVYLILALAAIASMLVLPAAAANTEDVYYYYTDVASGSWEYTNARYKTNSSKIYCYPTVAPASKTSVAAWCYSSASGQAINRTGTSSNLSTSISVTLTTGTKYAITNRVYEDGRQETNGVMTWLYLSPVGGSGTLYGCWSPDSSGSYTTIGG